MRELGKFLVDHWRRDRRWSGLVLWGGFAPKWLGRLPGDIRIEREHSAFYFPIVTCIILSIRAEFVIVDLPALTVLRNGQSFARLRLVSDDHVTHLVQCRRCPRMQSTPVSGGAVVSDVMLIGQAPGPREPVLQRPFAHTAGRHALSLVRRILRNE